MGKIDIQLYKLFDPPGVKKIVGQFIGEVKGVALQTSGSRDYATYTITSPIYSDEELQERWRNTVKTGSFSDERIRQIEARLTERHALLPCPRCDHNDFHLERGVLVHILTAQPHEVTFPGRGLPVVLVLCNHCGFVSEHALGPLNLLTGDEPPHE